MAAVNAACRCAITSRSVTRYGVGTSISPRVAGASPAGHWAGISGTTLPVMATVIFNSWIGGGARTGGSGGDLGAFAQQPAGFACRHRAGEVVALCEAAAHFAQGGQLAELLDAFGHGRHAEALAELDDRVGERGVVGQRAEPLDERAVDLQRVDREAPQVGQRRVA